MMTEMGDDDAAWNAMLRAISHWADRYMDQWENITIHGLEFGDVFVSIHRQVPDPERYDQVVDYRDLHEAETSA